MAGGHGSTLAFALFFFQPSQQFAQLADFAGQQLNASSFGAHAFFQIENEARHIAQLPLHGKRPFVALLAAGYRDVVEGLAVGGEEEGIGILQCHVASDGGIGSNVSIAELGQNHFQ